jgi:hypothetical protein
VADINLLINQLSSLAIRLQKPGTNTNITLANSLEELHERIDDVNQELDKCEIPQLPHVNKIAPNERLNWKETAAINCNECTSQEQEKKTYRPICWW